MSLKLEITITVLALLLTAFIAIGIMTGVEYELKKNETDMSNDEVKAVFEIKDNAIPDKIENKTDPMFNLYFKTIDEMWE